MSVQRLFHKHKEDIVCVLAAAALCSVVAAFIVAFGSDLLPYSSDGDAFDTVYALESSRAE